MGTLTGYGSYAIVLSGAVVVLLVVYGPPHLATRRRVTMTDLVSPGPDTDG
jgi:hypothetical protein